MASASRERLSDRAQESPLSRGRSRYLRLAEWLAFATPPINPLPTDAIVGSELTWQRGCAALLRNTSVPFRIESRSGEPQVPLDHPRAALRLEALNHAGYEHIANHVLVGGARVGKVPGYRQQANVGIVVCARNRAGNRIGPGQDGIIFGLDVNVAELDEKYFHWYLTHLFRAFRSLID